MFHTKKKLRHEPPRPPIHGVTPAWATCATHPCRNPSSKQVATAGTHSHLSSVSHRRAPAGRSPLSSPRSDLLNPTTSDPFLEPYQKTKCLLGQCFSDPSITRVGRISSSSPAELAAPTGRHHSQLNTHTQWLLNLYSRAPRPFQQALKVSHICGERALVYKCGPT